MDKIVRSICLFSETPHSTKILGDVSALLEQNNFIVQTQRLCLPVYQPHVDETALLDSGIMLGFGKQSTADVQGQLPDFLHSNNKAMCLDLTNDVINEAHTDILFSIIKNKAENTFRFSYGFNMPNASPFFPAATFAEPGFSIGLQATDLSKNCHSLQMWLDNMKSVWEEIDTLLAPHEGYLGIDSSVAPLFSGEGSLVDFIKRLGDNFNHTVSTDIYTRISRYIIQNNPRPVGLCGIMFPCLEDFVLADEYEQGNFSIERNIFLSLHSGTGIDTYPIGINQDATRVLEILRLVQALSNKYGKPLSARFVSDGNAHIGEKTNFGNQYLKDVIVKPL